MSKEQKMNVIEVLQTQNKVLLNVISEMQISDTTFDNKEIIYAFLNGKITEADIEIKRLMSEIK